MYGQSKILIIDEVIRFNRCIGCYKSKHGSHIWMHHTPEPLALPPIVTVLPSIFSDTAICFVQVSVVKIASLNAPGVAKLVSLICSVPV